MMKIDLQRITNNSLSLRLVSAIARLIPPRLGYSLADSIAKQITRRQDSSIIRAVRSNQWVVGGENPQPEALDQAIHATFQYWAHSIFDLYHYIQDPEATKKLIVLDSLSEQLTKRAQFDDRGLIVVGLHLSNFDLVLQSLCRQAKSPLVLTIPNPRGGRRFEYEIRKRTGVNLAPVSANALRQAIKYLQQGGMVVTGIDRPIPEPRMRPRFFGRRAALPVHHIFLATKAQVPVIIAAQYLEPDGKYHIYTSDFIEMDCYSNKDVEILENAEKVLNHAEEFVRRNPPQWSVPLPVWPEIMDLVPK